jgi:hypothetical protein
MSATSPKVVILKKNARRNLTDPDWEHGEVMDPEKKTARCNYCLLTEGGMVYSLKRHLAGT